MGILSVLVLTAACTMPPAALPPTAQSEQRILIPTPEARVTAEIRPTAQVADVATAIVTDVATPNPESAAESSSPLTAAQADLLATLPNRGAAPELYNEVWFNSEPLSLTDLRGKVVIVEFWTYG